MRILYTILAVVILVGMCQEDYLISLTAGGCALGMYYYLTNKKDGKTYKDRGSEQINGYER